MHELVDATVRILPAFTSRAHGAIELSGPPASGRTHVAIAAAVAAAEVGRPVVYCCVNPAVLDETRVRVPTHLRADLPRPGYICLTLHDDPHVATFTAATDSYVILDDADWYDDTAHLRASLLLRVTHRTGFTSQSALTWHQVAPPGEPRATFRLEAPVRGGPGTVEALANAGLAREPLLPEAARAEPPPQPDRVHAEPDDLCRVLGVVGLTVLDIPDPPLNSISTGVDGFILDRVAVLTRRTRAALDPNAWDLFVVVTADQEADRLDFRLHPADPIVIPVADTFGMSVASTVIPATNALLTNVKLLSVALTRHTYSSVIVAPRSTRHPVLDWLRANGRAVRHQP